MKFFKNNIGIISTLILVILLSQARIFDFLIETYLGRLILITFVSLIAYSNKIIGLIAVLFIIIAFNYNDQTSVVSYNFYEGFEHLDNETLKDKLKKDDKKNVNEKSLKDNENDTTSSSSVSSKTSSKNNNAEAREGFCMSDKELNMLRGKQSNAVPIFNNSRNPNNNVLPSEKSIFSDLFASF